jgi:hypothetical protein
LSRRSFWPGWTVRMRFDGSWRRRAEASAARSMAKAKTESKRKEEKKEETSPQAHAREHKASAPMGRRRRPTTVASLP